MSPPVEPSKVSQPGLAVKQTEVNGPIMGQGTEDSAVLHTQDIEGFIAIPTQWLVVVAERTQPFVGMIWPPFEGPR